MSAWHDLIDWVGGYPFEEVHPIASSNFYVNAASTWTSSLHVKDVDQRVRVHPTKRDRHRPMSPRVMFVSTGLHAGGAETVLLRLSQRLTELGTPCGVISLGDEGSRP